MLNSFYSLHDSVKINCVASLRRQFWYSFFFFNKKVENLFEVYIYLCLIILHYFNFVWKGN